MTKTNQPTPMHVMRLYRAYKLVQQKQDKSE